MIKRIQYLIIPFMLIVTGCGSVAVKSRLFYIPEGSIVLEYSPGLSVTAYSYPPGKAKAAVIFIHGGGWQTSGSEMPLYHNWEKLLLANQIRAFSIEHRTAPGARGKDLIEDVQNAVKFIQSRHEEFAFPRDRISLIGFSSGGHLAIMAALDKDPAVKIHSVAAFYPPLDMQYAYENAKPDSPIYKYLNAYLPENGRFTWEEISPIEALHKKSPPVLLIHGTADTLVPAEHSIRFVNKARSLGVRDIQLILVPGAAHSFDVSQSQWARDLETQTVRFILD